MLKKLALLSAAGVVAAAVWAAGPPQVEGRGKLEFEGHHGAGAASFEVSANPDGRGVAGRFLFSAEGIDLDGYAPLSPGDGGYPDVVVSAERLGSLSVQGNVATIRTKGQLHFTPVVLTLTLTDSHSRTVADHFFLRCDLPTGEHVFHVDGDLVLGNIVIR
ncbi:MAG: hypothetical protein M9921_00920 [Fimbriimonadaceae bacterium]|nr:hypothetical protein [Fimbriimonadaceae bacterium]